MAAPKHVAKKLREMLGNEAGESMVEWLDERDTHYDVLRQEARADIAELRQETRAEFAAVRQEMAALREEMRAGFSAVDVKFAQLREDMRAGFAALEIKFSQRNAELMKWALGFWIASLLGVVGALAAALTRLPR
jgi:hypothetical protein